MNVTTIPQGWEKLWKECKGGVRQSEAWISLQEQLGRTPFFVTLEEQSVLVAGMCFFEEKLSVGPLRKSVLLGLGSPLAHSEQKLPELLEKIAKETKKFFYVTFSPTIFEQRSFLGWPQVSNNTIVISLTQDKEAIWKQLEKKSIRWGVGYAERQGLTFQEATVPEVPAFYALYERTAREGKFHAQPLAYIQALARTPFSRLFLVKHKETIVAGGLVLIDMHNKITTLDLTTASDEGLKLQAMPFLYWNILLWAKKEGMELFDLGGYDARAKSGEKTYAINQYKERFGGQVVALPVYSPTKRYSRLRWVHANLRSIRKLYTKDYTN